MLFVFLSGLTGALYGISYKFRERRGHPIYLTLLLFSLFSTVFSAILTAVYRQPFFTLSAFVLGIPFGLTMIVSLSLYFVVTGKAKLNVSWLIIQFSVLIPFALSVVWYKERVELRAQIGIACMLVSLILFGLARRNRSDRPAVPDLKTGILLLLSSLFTGLAMCFPKIYTETEQSGGTFTLLLYRGAAMVPAALVLFLRKESSRVGGRPQIGLFALAAYMSLNGLLLGAFIIIALRSVSGSIAFPLRTVVNVLFVFLLSYILFGEKVKPMEAAGTLVALSGIVLVASATV